MGNYVYDTETGLYYLQSRYYNPTIGRFINADAYVSTGQGILGCNMFSYCNNNPILYVDSYGMTAMYPWEDYPGYLGRIIGEWIAEVIQTDENETDENGNLTTNAKAKRIGKSVYQNLDCSAGVGLGFEFSAEIAEVVGAGIGMHGDMFCVHFSDGELSYGQDYSAGTAISTLGQNFGFIESSYNKYFEYGELEIYKGYWEDDTHTLLSGDFYVGLGASFRIGFDLNQFLEDIYDIIS